MPDRIRAPVLRIIPLLSVFVPLLTYTAAFHAAADINMVISVFLGLYLPESAHSCTIGIKLPWTLADEENQKKNHAFAGPLWIGGYAMILPSFLRIQTSTILFLVVLVIIVVPGIFL